MKNKGVYIFRTFARAGVMSLGGLIGSMIVLHIEHSGGAMRVNIDNRDSVAWRLVPPDGRVYGTYNIRADSVYLSKQSDNVISHELKHAHNAAVFTKDINIHANEISARCAEFLAEQETKTIGSELSKFSFINSKSSMLPRNVNYNIPDIDQRVIDDVLLNALVDWEHIRGAYKPQRVASFFVCSFNMMSDADLAKLFTFQINGAPRSLFSECSPELREFLRDACNEDSVAYAWQHRKQRER